MVPSSYSTTSKTGALTHAQSRPHPTLKGIHTRSLPPANAGVGHPYQARGCTGAGHTQILDPGTGNCVLCGREALSR